MFINMSGTNWHITGTTTYMLTQWSYNVHLTCMQDMPVLVGCNRPVNVCNMPVTDMIFRIGYLHYKGMCVAICIRGDISRESASILTS